MLSTHAAPRPTACLASLAVAALLVLGHPAPAHAQAAQPEPPPQEASVWPPNEWLGRTISLPTRWLVDALTGALVAVGQTVLEATRRDVDWALGNSPGGVDFVSRTPPDHSYSSRSVRELLDVVRAAASLGLGLVAMWGGFQIMAGPPGRPGVHSAMELVPRLAFGALLANTSRWWCALAIDAANALGTLAGPVSLPGRQAASDLPLVLELVLTGLVYWLMALLLVLQQLMRLALLDALLVLSPLAMVLWVLPQTQAWGRLWSDLFLVTVFAQPVQMLVLKLGTLLVGELGSGGPLISMFLAVGMAYLVLKVPGLLRSGLLRGGGGGVGVLAAALAARQLVRVAR